MFRARLWMVMVLPLVAASCSSDNKVPQPPNVKPAQPPKSQPNTNVPQYKSSDANSPAPNAPPQPIQPKGAQFTIFCRKIDGELHVQLAEKIRADLAIQTEFKEWHVVHQAAESVLYYGFYKNVEEGENSKDKKEAERAQLDRLKIALMTDPMGNRPFGQAVLVPLTAPDPAAPPEWNLVNAKGDYTLQIATFKDHPERKEAAVESVRAAREQGIEAYYYHGPTMSMVCVGHWPRTSIKMIGEAPKDGESYMVAPPTDNPNLQDQYRAAAEANGTRLVQSKLVVTDPTLETMIRQYPHNVINNALVKRVENGQTVYVPSAVVEIPREALPVAQRPTGPTAAQAAFDQLQRAQPQQGTTATPPNTRPPQAPPTQVPGQPQPNVGRLRSIGG